MFRRGALALGVLAAASCSPSHSDEFATLCDQAVQAKLLAPSGYRRIAIGGATEQRVESAALTQFALGLGLKLSVADYDRLGDRDSSPAVFSREIEYDAPNRYNAPIRAKTVCHFFSIDGKFANLDAAHIAVDLQSQR